MRFVPAVSNLKKRVKNPHRPLTFASFATFCLRIRSLISSAANDPRLNFEKQVTILPTQIAEDEDNDSRLLQGGVR
jgi:hypothetical protein